MWMENESWEGLLRELRKPFVPFQFTTGPQGKTGHVMVGQGPPYGGFMGRAGFSPPRRLSRLLGSQQPFIQDVSGDHAGAEGVAGGVPVGVARQVEALGTALRSETLQSIDVVDAVRQNVMRIAASTSADGTGNLNCLAIARLGEQAMTDLDGLTTKQFYRQMAVDVGHDLSVMEMQYNNTEGILRSLQQHRDEISGVDVNEEASRMIIYERIFQAMAKYMNTINASMDTIISMLS